MKMKILAIAALCVVSATAVFAAENWKDQREASMKKIGGSLGAMVDMMKGKAPFDAAVVKTSLTTISATAKTFPDLFPVGSEAGDDEASPKIWETPDDFKARAAKLGADADALLAAAPPADVAAVGAILGTLGENCKGCHEAYRLTK